MSLDDIWAASENMGSWLAALWGNGAAFLHKGTSRNWFRTGFWGNVTVYDLEQNSTSFGDNKTNM